MKIKFKHSFFKSIKPFLLFRQQKVLGTKIRTASEWRLVILAALALVVPYSMAGDIQVGIGWKSKFVLDTEGRVWGWGPYSSDLADDFTYTPDSHQRSYYEPTLLMNLPPIKDMAFGGVDSALLDMNDNLLIKERRTYPWISSNDSGWKSVFPSEKGFLAINKDGTLWSQGRDDYGALGVSATLTYHNLTQIGGMANDWAYVSSGRYHSLAIKDNGNIYSWGRNYHGSLGIGDTNTTTTLIPQLIGAETDTWKEAEVGLYFSLGIKDDGSLWKWGSTVGGYGVNYSPNMIDAGPWATIAAGVRSFLAVKHDGSVWGAGNVSLDLDSDGLVSTTGGDVASELVELFPAGTSDPGMDAIETHSYEGGDSFILVRQDGSVISWGDNSYGQIGIAESAWRYEPVQVDSGATSKLYLGASATIMQRTDQSYDFLGTGSIAGMGIELYSTPISSAMPVNWPVFDQISCGMRACIAIDPDGVLWFWGYHHTFTIARSTVPKVVSWPPAGKRWAFTAISNDHSIFAILDDGTLWGVGYNIYGELGLGDTGVVRSLTQIGADTDWKAVYPADYFTLAEKTDGSLWAAGQNNRGVFGDGTTTGSSVFVPAASGHKFEKIVYGSDGPFLALTSTGELWGWGNNVWGTAPSSTNVPALLDEGPWQDIAMNQTSVSAIKGGSDIDAGGLFTWGYTPYAGQGKLYPDSYVWPPTMIGSDTDWANVYGVSRGSHIIATRNDGSTWGWGAAHNGALGNNIQNPHKFVEMVSFGGVSIPDFTPPSAVTTSPSGGLYQDSVDVTLSVTDNNDPAPDIFYGSDGINFSLYENSLNLLDSVTLYFYAEDSNGNKGADGSAIYTVNHSPMPTAPFITMRKDETGYSVIEHGDPDLSDTHTYFILTAPANGVAVVNQTGVVTYTPDKKFEGVDSIGVEVSDQQGGIGLVIIDAFVGKDIIPLQCSDYLDKDSCKLNSSCKWDKTDQVCVTK